MIVATVLINNNKMQASVRCHYLILREFSSFCVCSNRTQWRSTGFHVQSLYRNLFFWYLLNRPSLYRFVAHYSDHFPFISNQPLEVLFPSCLVCVRREPNCAQLLAILRVFIGFLSLGIYPTAQVFIALWHIAVTILFSPCNL